MKKILISLLLLVTVMMSISGCVWTNYNAHITLVNGYKEDVSLYFGKSEDFVKEKDGTYTVTDSEGSYIMGPVGKGQRTSTKIKLNHDLYGEYDWVVYYVEERDPQTSKPTKIGYCPVNGINDKYKLEFTKKYKITVSSDKKATIEINTDAEEEKE